ncbi:MAG: hypothetical protein WBG41_08465 [Acidimicrobiales bacterium]
MSMFRRSAAALALVIGALGSVGAVVVATATPSAAQLTCTDSWVGPTSGTQSWDTSANWSGGVPEGSSVACIQAAGTYTVVYEGVGGPEAVQVGGAESGIQTLEIEGANMSTTEADEVESGGVLDLAPTASADAEISGSGLTIDASGTLSSTGTSDVADIQTASLVNQGTVSLGATNNTDDAATTNEGSFTVESGASLAAGGAPSFTDASGTITNDGSFTGGNVFTQSGGDEFGDPVVLDIANPFIDSAGTGSFEVLESNIQGTIPAGQTVTNVTTNDTIGTSTAGVTVEGTLIGETTTNPNDPCEFSSGYVSGDIPDPGLTVASGGTFETEGPGSPPLQNVQITADIQVDPGGTMTAANPETLFEGGGFSISNSGTVQVAGTGELTIGGSSSLINNSGGTIGITAGTGAGAGLGGITDNSLITINGGTLAVATVGSPNSGTGILDSANGIGGPLFAGGSFGPDYYTISYVRNTGGTVIEVNVTPATPFSASPTSFSAAENEQVTTPQVASFTTNGEPGTYSATVNYEDGGPTEPATVNLSGDSGTVTGPTYTYIAPGSYTVTVVISTTAGTTISVSESITVTGPTVTGLSKSTVKPGKSLSMMVSGTDFDRTGAPTGFTTSDPTNLSVTSVVFKPATKKKSARYLVKLKAARGASAEQVSLILTQTGAEAGQTTDADAITVS